MWDLERLNSYFGNLIWKIFDLCLLLDSIPLLCALEPVNFERREAPNCVSTRVYVYHNLLTPLIPILITSITSQ